MIFKVVSMGNLHIVTVIKGTTVEPVYNGPVYSGHPVYNGHWSTSQKLSLILTVKLTCIYGHLYIADAVTL